MQLHISLLRVQNKNMNIQDQVTKEGELNPSSLKSSTQNINYLQTKAKKYPPQHFNPTQLEKHGRRNQKLIVA